MAVDSTRPLAGWVGYPVQMTGYEFRIDASPPRLGEDNEEVRSEWLR